LHVTPARREVSDRFGNKLKVGMIGIKRNAKQQEWEYKRYGPVQSIGVGVHETFFIISQTLSYLSDVVMGRQSADQLGGPIRIAEVSSQVASVGFVPLLNLTAVLSVSIGLINLFPIPLLDGGHLLFYLIEAVRRRPLSERTQEIGFRIGLAVVLMLMMFATWNDLGIVRRWLTGIG
jgi:regulator of sigma E protease